jgi:hypothetical protein
MTLNNFTKTIQKKKKNFVQINLLKCSLMNLLNPRNDFV